MPDLFFSKRRDPSYLICLVLVALSDCPQRVHFTPAELDGEALSSRDLKNRIRAIERLAEQRLITYSIFIPSTGTFRDVALTEQGVALLSRVPHEGGQTHFERLEAALHSGNDALLRLVVDELIADSSRMSSEGSDL